MNAIVLRGDARSLPLPDASVDLVVTSPPYWGLRSYTDDGEHYEGQIGSEETPGEWLAALLGCTREWMRVLKPSGSIFVNLGDKYDSGTTAGRVNPGTVKDGQGQGWHQGTPRVSAGRPKSLLGLPWRYVLACMDDLGLILRAEVIWAKPNGLPESVTDRVRRSHEQVFHFTRQPRYFAAVDEIRTSASDYARPRNAARAAPAGVKPRTLADAVNPLGALPGSVWEIPSAPLTVPPHLGVDHFAAFPPALVRPIVLGWSPAGICAECGEGRRPVSSAVRTFDGEPATLPAWADPNAPRRTPNGAGHWRFGTERTLIGYACACAPYTDHPGTGESSGADGRYGDALNRGEDYPRTGYSTELRARPKVGPWREYHLHAWTPPPSRPALVIDPFGGTGTTALVAASLGRTGISVDRSADYCRLAQWRVNDPGERARALGVPKPPPVPDGQASLFGEAS